MTTLFDPAADPKAECKRLEGVAKHAEASKARMMAILDNVQRDRKSLREDNQRLRETIRTVVEACEPLDDLGTGDIEAKLLAIPEKLRVREAEILAEEHGTTPKEATALVATLAESIKAAREDGRREGAREERKRIAIDLEAKAPVDALIAPLRNENDRLRAEVERLQEAARLGERFQPLADAEKKALEAQVERLARELESAREQAQATNPTAAHAEVTITAKPGEQGIASLDGLRAYDEGYKKGRRSTIEELVREAEHREVQGPGTRAYWRGVADWLRSYLDREPTEQPTPADSGDSGDWLGLKHDSIHRDPGRARAARTVRVEQPTPDAPSHRMLNEERHKLLDKLDLGTLSESEVERLKEIENQLDWLDAVEVAVDKLLRRSKTKELASRGYKDNDVFVASVGTSRWETREEAVSDLRRILLEAFDIPPDSWKNTLEEEKTFAADSARRKIGLHFGLSPYQPPEVFTEKTVISHIEKIIENAREAGSKNVLGLGHPWSVLRCLERLSEAANHLLDHHDCDTDGHEEVKAAAQAARQHVESIMRGGTRTTVHQWPRDRIGAPCMVCGATPAEARTRTSCT